MLPLFITSMRFITIYNLLELLLLIKSSCIFLENWGGNFDSVYLEKVKQGYSSSLIYQKRTKIYLKRKWDNGLVIGPKRVKFFRVPKSFYLIMLFNSTNFLIEFNTRRREAILLSSGWRSELLDLNMMCIIIRVRFPTLTRTCLTQAQPV